MYFLILGVLVLLGIFHFLARSQANKLRQLPDAYPLEVLLKEPEGEATIITTADGAKLRAVAKGSGTTVILAHGFGYSLSEWNIIQELLLKAGYRVIAFDQRGHGKSTIGSGGIGSRQMADDYRAVLEHYDVKDALLVGHSMGGFLGQIFLLNHPEIAKARLKGVVLFATFAGNVLKNAPQNRIQIPLIRYGILQRILHTDYGWLFGASLIGEPKSPAVIQAFLKVFGEQKFDPLIPIVEAFGEEDYYARLNEISLPCVVICGEKDNTTPKWHSEMLGKLIPNARNVWVKDKGHLLNWEAPESLIEAVNSLS